MPSGEYTITRDEAAKQLKLSTRTLDRWLRSGRLKHKAIGRSVFINAESLAKMGVVVAGSKSSGKPKRKQPKSAPTIHTPEPEIKRVTVERGGGEEKVYKELYRETVEDLKGKQHKLEAASFRVGQLEQQLKHSVPLLEFKQRENTLTEENKTLHKRLSKALRKAKGLWALIGLLVVAAVVLGVATAAQQGLIRL